MTFLERYRDDRDQFLDRIITGDEVWVAHITPETKQQSMHSLKDEIQAYRGSLFVDFLTRG